MNAAENQGAPDDSNTEDEARVGRRIWASVDRWGPGLVAVLTLFAVVGMGWMYTSRLARAEGAAAALQHQVDEHVVAMAAYRLEVQTWQLYVVALRGDMIKAGMNPAPLPTIAVPAPPGGRKPGGGS